MKFKTKPGFTPEAKFKDFDGDHLCIRLCEETAVFEATTSDRELTVRVAMPITKLRKLAKNILKEIGQ